MLRCQLDDHVGVFNCIGVMRHIGLYTRYRPIFIALHGYAYSHLKGCPNQEI
jgi:hypothetical protein